MLYTTFLLILTYISSVVIFLSSMSYVEGKFSASEDIRYDTPWSRWETTPTALPFKKFWGWFYHKGYENKMRDSYQHTDI